jgi:hypothetical protein
MAVPQLSGVPWTRKHDNPGVPRFPSVPRIVFPASLEDLIEICANRKRNERLHAAGSHWALSDAAFSDHTFIETNDPNNLFPAMDKTLYDVVPRCLTPQLIQQLAQVQVPPFDANTFEENAGGYFVHIETGKRVSQLYNELDQGDSDPGSLAVLLEQQFGNATYAGPWAFQTLGGAGGQTVFGALTTGTHGGDFRFPPIADAVLAMHLVADGGRHYWIERESLREFGVPITINNKLLAVYGVDRYRGREASGKKNFEIIRDDDVFNAVLIGAGRFGVVYSIVLKAVRQYTLHEERRIQQGQVFNTWQSLRTQIADPNSALFRIDLAQPPFENRFLQFAVSLTPFANNTRNLAGITKRWNVPMAVDPGTGEPSGRLERSGANAGTSHGYSPDPASPGSAGDVSLLERACTDTNFLQGVITVVAQEIEDFVRSNGAVIGAGLAAVAVVAGVATVIALLAALAIILALLFAFLAALAAGASGPHLGNALNDLKNTLLNRSGPDEQRAGILVWQMIAFELFSGQQTNRDYEAISYAVMDGHDYLDQSCNVNVDSIEVFFDAADPMLIAFVDAIIAFEIAQETMGRAFVGYASLRFTGPTRALIGEERFNRTCVVEVAGLNDVGGVKELIDFALTLALDPNFSGILHWGQRNTATRADIQRIFGDTQTDRSGSLYRWRKALARLTRNGRLDGFSSSFTRQTGLEIVTPRISSLGAPSSANVGQPFQVTWDCAENPPNTRVSLFVTAPSGNIFDPNLSLRGTRQFTISAPGIAVVTLVASIDLGGENRDTISNSIISVAA